MNGWGGGSPVAARRKKAAETNQSKVMLSRSARVFTLRGKTLKTIPSHLNIYSKLPEWSPTSSESKRPTNSANVSLCGVEVRLCYCFRPLHPGDNRLATSGNGILSGGHDVQVEKQVGPAGQRNYRCDCYYPMTSTVNGGLNVGSCTTTFVHLALHNN